MDSFERIKINKVVVSNYLDNLFMAHNGFNNFYNEPAHAKLLSAYIPNTGDVPNSVINKYVKVLTMCFMGNGYDVSDSAYSYYKNLLNRFIEPHIREFVQLLNDSDVRSRLQFSSCSNGFKILVEQFEPRVTDINLKQVLEYLKDTSNNIYQKLEKDIRFKQLISRL